MFVLENMLERGVEPWLADGIAEDRREDEDEDEGNGAGDSLCFS